MLTILFLKDSFREYLDLVPTLFLSKGRGQHPIFIFLLSAVLIFRLKSKITTG